MEDLICLYFSEIYKNGDFQHKMNFWSNKTFVPSQPFSEICFHDNRM